MRDVLDRLFPAQFLGAAGGGAGVNGTRVAVDVASYGHGGGGDGVAIVCVGGDRREPEDGGDRREYEAVDGRKGEDDLDGRKSVVVAVEPVDRGEVDGLGCAVFDHGVVLDKRNLDAEAVVGDDPSRVRLDRDPEFEVDVDHRGVVESRVIEALRVGREGGRDAREVDNYRPTNELVQYNMRDRRT